MIFKSKWVVYEDLIDNHKAIIRVNTAFCNKMYTHTYCLELRYRCECGKELPNKAELQHINMIEDKISNLLDPLFSKNVCFLGTVSFNGLSCLVYGSNLNIKWKELFNQKLHLDGGKSYLNDNMQFYNGILYPPYRRK